MSKYVFDLIVFSIMLFFSMSCMRNSTTMTTLFYENSSGADITIIKVGSNKEPIHIRNGSIYTEQGGGGAGDGITHPFGWYREIDVIFNNERIISYNVNDRKAFNNPLILSNYEIVKVKEEKYLTEYECYYTFVPEQYEMAEPYDPNEPEPKD